MQKSHVLDSYTHRDFIKNSRNVQSGRQLKITQITQISLKNPFQKSRLSPNYYFLFQAKYHEQETLLEVDSWFNCGVNSLAPWRAIPFIRQDSLRYYSCFRQASPKQQSFTSDIEQCHNKKSKNDQEQ